MCGIACIIDTSAKCEANILKRFTDAVAHRGPDGCGAAFFDSYGNKIENANSFYIGLGHRRLSIIDLSCRANQPLFRENGQLSIVFNGEIYNYIEIRKELENEGFLFASHSDTEVLLAAYSRWGKDCLNRFNGMWAFAILDSKQRKIFISRDRIGVKPLYYWQQGSILALASEIKQFFQLPQFKKQYNANVCLSYLVSGYENPPETFFNNVFAFPPGHYAEIDISKPDIKPICFWNPNKIEVRKWNEKDTIVEIRAKFSKAVRYRLRSDVPVGGCLSGGLDSSSIFVEMKRHSPNTTFNAFSSCFDDPYADERPFMNLIIEATSSNHIKIFPDPADFAETFEKFIFHHDEPVASVSMFAQFKVMEAARTNKIPVLLDGQGGDELFSGYWTSYMLALNSMLKNGRLFEISKDILLSLLPGGNNEIFSEILKNFCEFRKRKTMSLPFSLRKDQLQKLNQIKTLSWHSEAQKISLSEYRKAEIFRIHLPRLLKWEDRNSMAFAIESRVPFLDVNLVELMLSIPPEMNLKNGWTKYLFRKAMNDILPCEICWRKDKKGFETPQDKWMRKGKFHELLLDWTQEKYHPVSEFIENDFCEIRKTLASGEFSTIPMFRLFCLDKWMKKIEDTFA